MENITKRVSTPHRMTRPPGEGALDSSGRTLYARFEFPFDKAAAAKGGKRFFSGHFDAYCPWRLDDPELETDAFAPDMGYTRMHYIMKEAEPGTGNRALLYGGSTTMALTQSTDTLSRPFTPGKETSEMSHVNTPVRGDAQHPVFTLSRSTGVTKASIKNHPSFLKYESKRILQEPVDLDHLAQYVQQLRPRCAHDFKPMCYLLQSLMGHLLAGELEFFSSEVRSLKNDLIKMAHLLDQASERNQQTNLKSVLDRFKSAVNLYNVKSKMEDHGAYLVRQNEELVKENEDLRAQLAACQENTAALESKVAGIKDLHKQLKEAKRAVDTSQKELEALKLKSESEKKTLKSILGQKDKKIGELKKNLDELTGVDDATAQLARMSEELADVKRQLEEGQGMPVEDGDYVGFVEKKMQPSLSMEERAAMLGMLTPPEAARVLAAMGDWSLAGQLLRLNNIDFISDVLTCKVLDESDVASALGNLGDIDGTVLFAMMRKTEQENIAAAMRVVHPSIAANWLASAARQAKSRLSIGDTLGPDKVVDMMETQGDIGAVLVLDSQSPQTLASVLEIYYLNEEVDSAVELLLGCTGNTRIAALQAMNDEVREAYLAAMNQETTMTPSSFTCKKCGYCTDPNNTDSAGMNYGPSVKFTKALTEAELDPQTRKLEHMQPPASWLRYVDAREKDNLFKKWEKEGKNLINPIKVRSMITNIYQAKLKSDNALLREGKHRYPLPEYIVLWFDNNYGLKKLAQKKMVLFIYSLQAIYEEGKDMRVSQFVRLCGLYHPLPNILCDLLIECLELISFCLSGSGELFRSDTEFWSTWASGKSIPLDRKRQLEIFKVVFGPRQDASALLARLDEELAENPESSPAYDRFYGEKKVAFTSIPDKSVSLSRYVSFLLKVIQEGNLESHDAAVQLFRDAAGTDKVVSFQEFKDACMATKPINIPSEGSFAFMYWSAVMMEEESTTKEIIDAVLKWEISLEKIGGAKATVEVDVAVESFMWYCGLFNMLGIQADGQSMLLLNREKTKVLKSTRAVAM